MKKLSTFLAVVLLVGGVGPLAAQQAGEDILVMVDVSKSMLRDQLFSRVQQDLAEIAGSLKVGDRLIVYAFGSDVLPVEEVIIAGSSDIAASRRRLANLRADQDWTYLTRAIDVAARRFGELQELDRDRRKTVFILTDGENDPPPWAGEDVISFADIVRVHGASLCSHAGAVYLVTFGVDMPPGDAEQIGLIQCLEVISEPRQAERGTAMPAILRVLPEEQTVAVGALGEEPVFVEVSFALIRLPGLRGPVRVSLVPEPVDGLQTAGPVEFTLQEDSATATLGMEVSREAMAEGRARVLIRAGAGAGVRVDPETLIVVFESAPDPLLSWAVPARASYSVQEDAVSAEVNLSATWGGGDSLAVSLRVISESGRWGVEPPSLLLAPGANAASLRLEESGGTPDEEVELSLQLEASVPVRIEPPQHALRVVPPPSRTGLYITLACLVAVLSLLAYVKLGIPRFAEDLRLSLLDPASGVAVDTLDLRDRQGLLLRRLVISEHWPVEGVEPKAFAVSPAGIGIQVHPLHQQGRVVSRGSVPESEAFRVEAGESFEFGDTRFRIHEG